MNAAEIEKLMTTLRCANAKAVSAAKAMARSFEANGPWPDDHEQLGRSNAHDSYLKLKKDALYAGSQSKGG